MSKQFDLQPIGIKWPLKAKNWWMDQGFEKRGRPIPRFRHLDQRVPSTAPQKVSVLRTRGTSRSFK